MPVLGLAGCHGRKWKSLSRYVDWASPIHITVQQMRLRWMETSEAHSIPLHENWKSKFMNSQNKEVVQQSTDRSFTSIQMVHTHASLPRGYFLSFEEWFGKLSLLLPLRTSRCASSIADVWKCLHSEGLIWQCASRFCQMTGKVSQVCCREDLNRMSCQVIIWILESF